MSCKEYDVIIIGGGLAGLCCAVHLSKSGRKVLLVEKHQYPRHKVCGEYISNETLPYLKWLGFNPYEYGAKRIDSFELTTHNNKRISAELPLGGFGMSRYELDYRLAELAKKTGTELLFSVVTNISFKEQNNQFQVITKSEESYTSKIVIGAFGKRSNLDVALNRKFIKNRAPYLGVKIHTKGSFPENKVALHNFSGGYCGVSKVENDNINLCYITDFKSFKKYKDIKTFQEKVLFENEALKQIFSRSKPQFENPLTISQISFETKQPVEGHILMCGDTAGMIHPLCGNGMAMAIRSAKIVSVLIIDYLEGKIKNRKTLEDLYKKTWRQNFNTRLRVGHFIAYLLRQRKLAPLLYSFLRGLPFLVPKLIKATHGRPMTVPVH